MAAATSPVVRPPIHAGKRRALSPRDAHVQVATATIAAGVFGGVTGGGTDALVALYRTLGLSIFQSAFAQGLTSDPLDKTISYTIVYLILIALPITVRTMFSRGETTVADAVAA